MNAQIEIQLRITHVHRQLSVSGATKNTLQQFCKSQISHVPLNDLSSHT
jgi:hypothetical protein